MEYTNSKIINGINISKQLIDKNYTKGIFITPKYIVIHDTNNRDFGATAKFNRDFISVNSRIKASAHYIIDDKNIIQLLEDNFRGWHVGDKPNEFITNSNSLAIELCVNRDNSFNKTINNTLILVRRLMKKYNIDIVNIKRHYDVTGKKCPRIMLEDNPSIWPSFKEALKNEDDTVNIIKPIFKGKIISVLTSLNVKEHQSKESNVIGKIKKDEEFYIYEEKNNWYKIVYNTNEDTIFAYLAKSYVEIIDMKEPKRKIKEYIAKEVAIKQVEERRGYIERTSRVEEKYVEPNLKSYTGIEAESKKSEIKQKNTLAIREEAQIVQVKEVRKQIIDKKNTTVKSPVQRKGRVSGTQINLAVRKGPESKFYVIAYLLEKEEIIVLEKINEWYKIKYNSSRGQREGFVEVKFIEFI